MGAGDEDRGNDPVGAVDHLDRRIAKSPSEDRIGRNDVWPARRGGLYGPPLRVGEVEGRGAEAREDILDVECYEHLVLDDQNVAHRGPT